MGWVSPRLRTGCANAPVRPRARIAVSLLLLTGLALAVASCGPGGNGEKLGERVVQLGEPVPKGGGTYVTGAPYQVAGVWYAPREDPSYDRVGTASWYGELFHGRRTANGEIYDMDRLSAAHPTLPLPVYAQVTNLANGRTIVVRVNDRGPYANDRIIDLSRRSADLLGFRNSGTAQVRVRYLKRAPLNGDDSYERRYVANQSWMHVAANGGRGQPAPDPTPVGSLPGKTPPSPRDAERWECRGRDRGAARTCRAWPAQQWRGDRRRKHREEGCSLRGSSSRRDPSKARPMPTKRAWRLRSSPRSR